MTRSPFQAAAPAMRAHGYSVIPLAPTQKYPTIERWSEYCSRLPTDEEHTRWMGWVASNIGLCLGSASGVMALDFDDDVDGLHERILAIVPDSPVKKRGAKGFTAFYRYGGQRSQGLSLRGTRVLDVLSDGRQTVLPPSLHPSGGAYEWMTPRTLADLSPDDLPEIPAAAMQAVGALFRSEPARPASRPFLQDPYRETDLAEVADALRCIPADDYDVWIRMGMALRQHLGDRGMALWDQWSSTSSKYDAREIPKRWRSFNRADITIASLFYTAMDHGYIPPRRMPERPELPAVVIEEGGNLRPFASGRAAQPSVDAAILNPPGLVGRVARWINDTSIYPQPMLAVAAAITAAGVAMSHKVQSPTRLRTNFYTMGLAPSGAGKDHARDCVTTLLCRAGLEGLIGGTPASGAGLLTALREGGGRCLVLWDEFGRVLKNLTHKNAGSHQRDILTYLIELFSSSKSMYAGVQYANHDGKMKRTPIDQPCLSVYATTVPERFFQTLTSDDAIDGFLARWLVLESKEYTLKPAKPAGNVNDPPEEILAELRRWKDAPSNYDPRGNVDGVLRISPMVVSYSEEAEKIIGEYSETMRRRAAEESAARSGLSAIYARSAEHAIKLALVAHEGDTIGAEAMSWGIAMADHCAAYMAEAVKANVAESDHERNLNRVLQVIRDGKGAWVENRTLLLRTRNLKFRERNEIIADLVESGEIEREEVEGKTKRSYRFRAVR
ncbi:bifunctional DNA primase/polymerase [Tautonia marina]|uniref:bifunctional DNA primase/polymerase n=1 Tax=Tautonia marina TaxID=2653855 RepID=UPI00126068B9|nr:PriCT-2 domain-containing protein [Tautonia marina]